MSNITIDSNRPTPDPEVHRPRVAARHPRRWAILAVLCLSLFVVTLDNTVLNVALPSLGRELALSTSQIQWVVDAYSLIFAGLLLAAGSIGDRFGRRRALIAGLALFGLGSGAAALTTTAASLILARGAMGMGGALMMPATLAIIVHVFEADERPRAIAVWGGVSALGVSAGPVIGGLLVNHFWWGSVFLVNVPVAILALVGIVALVPESRRLNAPRTDFVGAALSSAAIVTAVWALIGVPEQGWTGIATVERIAAATVLTVLFVSWERRCEYPMVHMTLLRSRQFAGASAVGVLLMFSLAGTTFLMTQYLQLTLGYSPLEAGVRTLPVAAALALTAPLSPAFAARVGNDRAVAVGLFLLAAGLCVIALDAAHESYRPLAVGCLAIGAGIGLAITPASATLMSSFPREHAGVGSAMNDTLQELGAALGVAVIGGIAAAAYRSGLPSATPAFARTSYGETLALATREGADGSSLALAARSAFDSAMHQSLLWAAFAALAGAVVGLVVVQRHAVPVDDLPQGLEAVA